MLGAIPSLPQYPFMAWCAVKAQGQLYFYLEQTDSGAHPASYLIGTMGSFPGGKAAGA
jgi:hypothetical protein